MDNKDGYSLGMDDAALRDLLRRLHERGFHEARSIDDPTQLGKKQYFQRPDFCLAAPCEVRYWKVMWREH